MASLPDPGTRPSLRQALTPDNAERILGAGLALCAVALHIRFFLHAGGLWRDEVQIVNLANTSPLSRWWALNEHDTFPVVWQALVRLWTALGPGRSDAGLRALGAGVGLAMMGALYFAARRLGARVPLLALALFALNPVVIRYGDSLRGYGAGALTMLLMLGAVSRAAAEPGRRTFAIGLCAALLGVHTMHFNAVVLLGLGAAAVSLSLVRQASGAAVAVISLGVAAAMSIVPYADPILRQRQWNEVVVHGAPDLMLYLQRFAEAASESGTGMAWIWPALLCSAFTICIYRGLAGTARVREQAAFLSIMMGAGVVSYAAFLLSSRLSTMPWYYIALMGLLSVAFDASFALLVDVAGDRARQVAVFSRVILVALIAAVVLPRSWQAMEVRMTPIDLSAKVLTQRAGPQDLIVVTPFWYGITFQRYYHGKAPVLTVPMLSDLDVQRFDLVRQEMAKPDPIGPVLARIAGTLQAGHRVFTLGNVPALLDGELPAELPPGTLNAAVHMIIWTQQVSYLLQRHSLRFTPLYLADPAETFEHERPNLIQAEGWR